MPSKEPPPKDNGGQSKSQPPKSEIKKNDANPKANTAVFVGVFVVVVGIVLYTYFGA